jgi:hypothetical protein
MAESPPSDTSTRSLSILLQTPASDAKKYHERVLEGIPETTARQVVEDFSECRDPSTEDSPYKLYNYTKGGTEHHLALDFTEVIVVHL